MKCAQKAWIQAAEYTAELPNQTSTSATISTWTKVNSDLKAVCHASMILSLSFWHSSELISVAKVLCLPGYSIAGHGSSMAFSGMGVPTPSSRVCNEKDRYTAVFWPWQLVYPHSLAQPYYLQTCTLVDLSVDDGSFTQPWIKGLTRLVSIDHSLAEK